VNGAIALVIAETDMTLSAPTVVVGVTGATGKKAGSSAYGKVVCEVEGRHSKVFII
jgi:hypothetical protein